MARAMTVRRWAARLGAVWLGWAVVATWLVPWLIAATHAGRLPFLGRLMPGASRRALDGYLATWDTIARGSIVMLLTLALVLLAALLVRQHAIDRPAADAAPQSSIGGVAMVMVAVWIGLLTGFGEAYYLVLKVFYLHQVVPGFRGVSQHAVWMAPVADAAFFGILGMTAAVIHRVAHDRIRPGHIFAFLIWLGLFDLVMVTRRLHWVAAMLLTSGLARILAGIVRADGRDLLRLARRQLPWMAMSLPLLAAGVVTLEEAREHRQLRRAGTIAATTPNVVFIVLDTERAKSTSLHGNALPTTPFLASLADSGAWFRRAIAPTSWTLPSHASMFTGRIPSELDADWLTPLGKDPTTLAEVLSERGYATAGFVANPSFLTDLFGLDRGFGRWQDQPLLPGIVIRHGYLVRTVVTWLRARLGVHQLLGRKTADRVNREFLRWLDDGTDRPFFAFLNYFDPHAPYLPPQPHNLRFSTDQPRYWLDGEKEPASNYTDEQRRQLELAYQSSLAYLDDRLQQLYLDLSRRDLLARTVIVITADHGEAFGDGNHMDHGQDLILAQIHVPLLIVHPARIAAGRVIDTPVELRHLAATVLALTGGPDPRIAGHSLLADSASALDADAAPAFSELRGQLSLVSDAYHFLWRRTGVERLFDIGRDPGELHDLSGDPAYRALLPDFRRQALARLQPARRALWPDPAP